MDSAKAIGLASTGTKSVWEYLGSRAPAPNAPAFIQIPTMAGTGSENNVGAVVTDWEHTMKRTPLVRLNSCPWLSLSTGTDIDGAEKAGCRRRFRYYDAFGRVLSDRAAKFFC